MNKHSNSLVTDVTSSKQVTISTSTSKSENPESWSAKWILRRIQNSSKTIKTLQDLKTFTHKSHQDEISLETLKALKEAPEEQALFYLNNLHQHQ